MSARSCGRSRDWSAGARASGRRFQCCTPVDVLEKHYSTTPYEGTIAYGSIIGIADGARFHLRSAHQILSALFPDQPAFLTALDELLSRLEFGLPAGALGLTSTPPALLRGQYLSLFAAGCATLDDARNLPAEQLIECVGFNAALVLRPNIGN